MCVPEAEVAIFLEIPRSVGYGIPKVHDQIINLQL